MATKKRSRYVRNTDWDRYKHVVQKFLEDDSGRQTIGWCRHIDQMLFMGEDKAPKYTLVLIEALCYYNAFRNWPINKATVSGELDDENLVILIPKSAITKYLNPNGYLKFNWSEDRFIINGIPYKPDGDTEVAQAKDEPIVFQIILKRDRDTVIDASSFDNSFADINGVLFLGKNSKVMYNSQYYTCEQIDERLLQGYVDDYNTQTGQSLTKEQFLTKLGNIFDKETVIDNTAVNIGYFICDTAAGTAAKAITAAGYALFQGGSIKVKFLNRNTAGSATLNINSQGAKALYYGGKAVSASNSWDNDEVVEIYYDGTSYYANNVEGNFKDGIFDISAYNLTEGQPTKYDTLAEALGTNGNNVPPIFRKGGMQIKYVSTSDNNYVQFRCMAQNFTTDVTQWQGVDDEPTAGSKNLVESGSVKKNIDIIESILSDITDYSISEINFVADNDNMAYIKSGNVVSTSTLDGWSCMNVIYIADTCTHLIFSQQGFSDTQAFGFVTDSDDRILVPVNKTNTLVELPPMSAKLYWNHIPNTPVPSLALVSVNNTSVGNVDKKVIHGGFFDSKTQLIHKYPFVADRKGRGWYNNSGAVDLVQSNAFEAMNPIEYNGGLFVYHHPHTPVNYTLAVFVDDSDNVIGILPSSTTEDKLSVTPPTGTHFIYINKHTPSAENDVYFEFSDNSLTKVFPFGTDKFVKHGFVDAYTNKVWINSNGAVTQASLTGWNSMEPIDYICGLVEFCNPTPNVMCIFADDSGVTKGVISGSSVPFYYLPPVGTTKIYINRKVSETPNISDVYFNILNTFSSTDLQAILNNSSDIQLSAGVYEIASPLNVKSGTRIVGVPGMTIFKLADECETILEVTGKIDDIIIDGITFVGKNPTTSRPVVPNIATVKELHGKTIGDNIYATDCGIYIHAGGYRVTVENCKFVDFGFAGIKIDHTLTGSGGFRYAPRIEKCRFYNNYYGLFVGERGEFCDVNTCEFANNAIGILFLSSNTRFTSCQCTQNYLFGIVFIGGYENGGHTVIGDCQFIHNGYNTGNADYPTGRGTYDVLLVDGGAGVSFTGCYIGIDGVMLNNAKGFAFVGCQFICPIWIETPVGLNMIHDCMWRTGSSFLGTIINGDSSHLSLKNNRYYNNLSTTEINNNV